MWESQANEEGTQSSLHSTEEKCEDTLIGHISLNNYPRIWQRSAKMEFKSWLGAFPSFENTQAILGIGGLAPIGNVCIKYVMS